MNKLNEDLKSDTSCMRLLAGVVMGIMTEAPSILLHPMSVTATWRMEEPSSVMLSSFLILWLRWQLVRVMRTVVSNRTEMVRVILSSFLTWVILSRDVPLGQTGEG